MSEDELPEVQKPSIKDAENVSDDELPGPKPAELPADTEVQTLVVNQCALFVHSYIINLIFLHHPMR